MRENESYGACANSIDSDHTAITLYIYLKLYTSQSQHKISPF